MNSLDIKICNSIEEAPNYNTYGQGLQAATLLQAIIVRHGTKEGLDTVDLIFEDAEGRKYVSLVTARILKAVTNLTNTEGIWVFD